MFKVPSWTIPRVPEKATGIKHWENGPEDVRRLLLKAQRLLQELFAEWQLWDGLVCHNQSTGSRESKRLWERWYGRQCGQGYLERGAAGQAHTWGGKGATCPLPGQQGGRSWCSHSPLLLCSPARMQRWSFVLMLLMISTPSSLFTVTSFTYPYRAVATNGAALVSMECWFTGGWHGRLSLQSRMCCLHFPLLPGKGWLPPPHFVWWGSVFV